MGPSEDRSPAFASPRDSMPLASAPELASPILRQPTQAASLPLLTALQPAEPTNLPDSPFKNDIAGGATGIKHVSAEALSWSTGVVTSAEGADAGPQSGGAVSTRRRLDFQASAETAALHVERDAAGEDPTPGSLAGEQEMDIEELPEHYDKDGSNGLVKETGIPAAAAGLSIIKG